MSSKLYSERTDIRSCHEVVLVSRYVLDKVGRTDAARATLLVEDVDNVDREVYVLVHVIVDTAECFPTSVEVEAVGLVDILLALIAEACPYAELVELIARVKLDDCLAHAGCNLVVEVVLWVSETCETSFIQGVFQNIPARPKWMFTASRIGMYGPAKSCELGCCMA